MTRRYQSESSSGVLGTGGFTSAESARNLQDQKRKGAMSTSLLTFMGFRNQRGNLDFFNITVAILAALFTLLALGVAISGDAGVVAAH